MEKEKETKVEESSVELAKVDEKVISSYKTEDGKVMGLEDYSPSTVFGYLKLDNSSGSDTFGMIEYSLTGEKKKSWDVILLDYSFSRILFPEGMNSNEPLCKTIKREKNPNLLEGSEYGTCITCEHSQWEGRTPPPCRESINFTGLIGRDMATPFSMQFRGASYKVGTGLLNSFWKAGRPLFSSVITISAEKQTKGSVTYYVLTYKEKEALSAELISGFAEAYAKFKDNSFDPMGTNDSVSLDRKAEILTSTDDEEDEPFKS